MSLFQNSVIEKHLKNQDKNKLLSKWDIFKNHFHNPTIQDNIRNSKEEQYQGEFLIDLFVNVLGYIKNPTPDFNLTTEYKNVKDSKKADGAIILNDKVKAVIELKGTNTTDLNKIETQAFGYKNNQPECVYIVTSNFEKLRFYIDNATEYLEFNLFKLTEKEFELIYLCLAYENISNDIPKKIKEQSISEEKEITKKLYSDYSIFKRELHQNLVILNPGFDALELFKKSQKLLDRFLFIFFAEDRNLLPTNLIFRINKEWRQLQEMRMNVSLYDRYKTYFKDLNQGAKVILPAFTETMSSQKEEHQIFAYNGGLFQPDSVLDNIQIDDELLYKYTQKLSHYDFQSEIDVNILGHIFENSLNEFDEVKAHLEGETINKQSTKRKKDGVFYTPKYITKYIVDNTIGKLCTDKKIELKIVEENYITDKKRTKTTKQPLFEKLTKYRNWLLQITICDPACGSGAFLNQALDFLIAEHRYVDELQAKLFGDALILSDVEKSILENNLYGVDLNEESVEIAKLSLWLRTAQPNRKLNDLNNNIKCGNSLIDDSTIAGESAFNWKLEFPKVFAKSGFDVVIGNPPYVRPREIDEVEKKYIQSKYVTASNQFDLYHLFIEKIKELINYNGLASYIVPNAFLSNETSKDLRKFILSNFGIQLIVECKQKVFDDANVEVAIFNFDKKLDNSFGNYIELSNNVFIIKHKFNFNEFSENKNNIFSINLGTTENKIFKKIRKTSVLVSDHFQVMGGIKEYQIGKGKPAQTKEMKENNIFNAKEKIDETYIPEIRGKHLLRYGINWNNEYVSYGNWLAEPRDKKYFLGEKILIRQIPGKTHLVCSYTDKDYIIDQSAYLLKQNHKPTMLYKYALTILCSKLIFWFFRNENNEFDDLFPKIKSGEIKNLPIKKVSLEVQKAFIIKADLMLVLNKDLQQQSQKFQRTIQRKFEIESLPKKLQDWYLLSYLDFIKELSKLKIKLSLSQEAEWETYFNDEAKKVLVLKTQLESTDKTIDKMVYELYGLTNEEIAIVENI